MSHLFSPLRIRGVELRNRLVVSPMCQYSAENGFANQWHLVHLGSFAVGGAGLVMTEATAISPEGRISAADLGIWSDEHLDVLCQITQFITQQGAVAGIQLSHAGRKASHTPPWKGGKQVRSVEPDGWKTAGPSAIAFTDAEEAPEELDAEGIEKVISDFRTATLRALEAGFQVVEIHAAHGYLIHEFLSPISNRRTDGYGGPFENRVRLLLEVAEAVRSVWPAELPLFVRISATDWTAGGWTAEESVQLAELLREHNVDLVDCSTGGNVPRAAIPLKPGYQVEFSEQVRATGILTGAVGLITDARQANEIVETGKADLVFMARELLRDPHFPLRAAHELGHEMDWPAPYERARWPKPVTGSH